MQVTIAGFHFITIKVLPLIKNEEKLKRTTVVYRYII
jgi:hypothetical protein